MQNLSIFQSVTKRVFDLTFASLGLVFTGWIIIIAWFISCLDTRKNGFFTQERIGKDGKKFKFIKIRSMRELEDIDTTVTTDKDPRITSIGRLLRKSKLDELPQLINVFLGDMSFVGPRPDVPGYADKLEGDERIILSVRPGITGPATLKYRKEENLLTNVEAPEKYNREVIWPDKVRLNKLYLENWSLKKDIIYIWKTIAG